MSKPLYCENCNALSRLETLPSDCLRYAVLENTLKPLRDVSRVEWKCPHCDYWHRADKEP